MSTSFGIAGGVTFAMHVQRFFSRMFVSEREGVGELRLLLRGVGIEEV